MFALNDVIIMSPLLSDISQRLLRNECCSQLDYNRTIPSILNVVEPIISNINLFLYMALQMSNSDLELMSLHQA